MMDSWVLNIQKTTKIKILILKKCILLVNIVQLYYNAQCKQHNIWYIVTLIIHILEYFTNSICTIYSRGPAAIYKINARHRGYMIINKLMQICVKMYKNQNTKCSLTVLACMILWNRVHFTHCKTSYIFLCSYLLNREHDNS